METKDIEKLCQYASVGVPDIEHPPVKGEVVFCSNIKAEQTKSGIGCCVATETCYAWYASRIDTSIDTEKMKDCPYSNFCRK